MPTSGRYPGAAWLPSPNITSGNQEIRAVVIHVTQGTYESAVGWLRNRQSQASAHFVVAKDGRIAQLASIQDTAWGNGLSYSGGRWYNPRGRLVRPAWPGLLPGVNPNGYTISIEHEGTFEEPWTEAMYAANNRLLQWIAQQTDLRYVAGRTLIRHADLDNIDRPNCPGPTVDLVRMAADATGAIIGAITADSLLLAAPRATAEQCIRYMLSRPHGEYLDSDIAQVIVPAYFELCVPLGLDPLWAIAQMIHETGNLTSWWSQRPRRNPAGIGVTGEPGKGVLFATWKDDAIPAHVGRLLAYALKDAVATQAQRAAIARALSYRILPADRRGVAATPRGLGGTWAVPGTDYGLRLAAIAGVIVAVR